MLKLICINNQNIETYLKLYDKYSCFIIGKKYYYIIELGQYFSKTRFVTEKEYRLSKLKSLL